MRNRISGSFIASVVVHVIAIAVVGHLMMRPSTLKWLFTSSEHEAPTHRVDFVELPQQHSAAPRATPVGGNGKPAARTETVAPESRIAPPTQIPNSIPP